MEVWYAMATENVAVSLVMWQKKLKEVATRQGKPSRSPREAGHL